MKKMSKLKLLALFASVVVLVLFQREVVLPFAKNTASSDLFLIESNDQASMMTQSNDMTQFAFEHCNTHLKADLDSTIKVTLPEKPLNAWSLGNYEYVVSSEADVSHEGSEAKKHKYVCRISYKNGDDTSGAAKFENWSLDGLSKVDD